MIGTLLKTNEFRSPKQGPQIWSKNFKQFLKNGKEYGVRKKVETFIEEENLQVELNNNIITELPFRFFKIYQAIEKSKYILELEDDWDEEDSAGYKENTWKKAIEFIANYANWVLDETSIIIDTPKIFPGPEGSIDILWKKHKYRLLINIPEDPQSPASFYGDDFESEQIKGTFEPSKFNQGLILCLLSMT